MTDASPFDDFDGDNAINHEDAVDLGSFEHQPVTEAHPADGAAVPSVAVPTHDTAPLAAPPVEDAEPEFDFHSDSKQGGNTAAGTTMHEHDDIADPFAGAVGDDVGGTTEGGDIMQTGPTDDELAFQGPTPLSIWEAERAVVIQQRIQKAKADKAKALEDAKKELSSFYKQREETIKKTQVANREDEKNLKADMEGVMTNGTMWEKVARLANVQPKANEDRKVARMRKLLLQLKTDRVDEDMKAAAKTGATANGPTKKKGGK